MCRTDRSRVTNTSRQVTGGRRLWTDRTLPPPNTLSESTFSQVSPLSTRSVKPGQSRNDTRVLDRSVGKWVVPGLSGWVVQPEIVPTDVVRNSRTHPPHPLLSSNTGRFGTSLRRYDTHLPVRLDVGLKYV